MTDGVRLKLIGERLNATQAEQRTLRSENALIRRELARLVSREGLDDVLNILVDRIAALKVAVDTRLDEFGGVLGRIEARLAAMP